MSDVAYSLRRLIQPHIYGMQLLIKQLHSSHPLSKKNQSNLHLCGKDNSTHMLSQRLCQLSSSPLLITLIQSVNDKKNSKYDRGHVHSWCHRSWEINPTKVQDWSARELYLSKHWEEVKELVTHPPQKWQKEQPVWSPDGRIRCVMEHQKASVARTMWPKVKMEDDIREQINHSNYFALEFV